MKLRIALSLSLAVAVVLLVSRPSSADKEDVRLVIATRVLTEVTSVPGRGIPPSILKEARGIVVIPDVFKVAFLLGGRWGSGVVSVRDDEGRWSLPSFVTIGGMSAGLQLGAQRQDLFFVFMTDKGVEHLTFGKLTLGADAAVAAGPVGARAEAATDIKFKADIYTYSRTSGLFAGVSLSGAAIQTDDEANESFYGKRGIKPDEIFSGSGISVSDEAVGFREALSR